MKLSFCVLFAILSLASSQVSYFQPHVRISELIRTVDLTGQYPVSNSTITLQVDQTEKPVNYFYHLVQPRDSEGVFSIRYQGQNYLQITKISSQIKQETIKPNCQKCDVLAIKLPEELKSGSKITFTLTETFVNRYNPLPKEITVKSNQKLTFDDSLTFYSLYEVSKQQVSYRVSNLITYKTSYDKKKPQLHWEFTSSQSKETSIPINLHFENNNPIMVFKKVQKTIEISHWGNIAVDIHCEMENRGAALTGEFSRVDYNKYQQVNGKNALKELQARLPLNSWGVYYHDEIGNISTSNAWKSKNDRTTYLKLQPRFPIFGGWKANFNIGYNQPTEKSITQDLSEQSFTFKYDFGHPFPDMVAENYQIKVILPEGASDVNYVLPFPVEESEQGQSFESLTYSYLDTQGRKTYIFKKKHINSLFNSEIVIKYKLSPLEVYRKPFLVFLVILTLFVLLIFFGRVQLESFSKSQEKKD